jgi:hypothetical protein
MNEVRHHIDPETQDAKREKGKAIPVTARVLASILGGSILTRHRVVQSLPFLGFLAGIALLYIANTYYAEKTIMKSYHLRKELKELRYEFVTTRSRLMFESKQSEVARRLEERGIRESRVPPVKIRIEENKH